MPKNNELPKVINILGIPYEIKAIPEEDLAAYEGRARVSRQCIEINETCGFDQQLRILWHEMVHTIRETVCIKDDGDLEAQCDLFATGINQVLRDNPALVAIYAKLSKGAS